MQRERTRAVGQPALRRRYRWLRWVCGVLAVLIVGVVAVRLALPTYLQHHVNRVLDRDPRYDGRIGAVHVHLWRGAYSIDDLKIVKTNNAVPVPFFEAKRMDISLSWNALAHGVARGNVVLEHPKLNFVHGPTEDQSQIGDDQDWLSMFDELFPFRIDEAVIDRGEIHFRAYHLDVPVDVYLSRVEGTIKNLTNVDDKLDPLTASVQATGAAMNSGRFEFEMNLDAQSHRPTFELAARMLDVDARELNSLTVGYGHFDFEAGQCDLIVELAAKDGVLRGYAKPLFRNLKVISHRDVQHDDPLQVFWEALVGIAEVTFRNQLRAQFGTRFEIEGSLDAPRITLLEVIANVLRNAFIRAFLPTLERGVESESIEFAYGSD